jgi:ribose ABC transporter, ATP-binding protein RbsA
MSNENNVILEARNISKHFGGTKALDSVSFNLRAGEVHALMGENGAGKSTLGKIFAGIHKADSGEIVYFGETIHLENPKDAKRKKISIVLQELNLLPDLTVAENLLLGSDVFFNKGVLRTKAMYKHAKELLNLFNLGKSLDVYSNVENLTVAQMQVLEILKAVDSDAKVIILDEPTATLSPMEVEELFSIVRKLQKEKNIGFIIVSHKINEIFEIADRVTVFRDGKQILNGKNLSDMTESELVSSMVGREINDLYGHRKFGLGKNREVVLKAENICDYGGKVKNVSIELRKGEILGITGIVGAGRTEFIRCIFGVDKIKSGKITINGKELVKPTIKKAIRSGLALVPEDRKNEGLILNESIKDNVSLVRQCMQKGFVLRDRDSRLYMEKMRKELLIKMGDELDPCNSLSGGNQQKVLLGKWLVMSPNILIIDEPTRGIDISAKSEIYATLNKLAEQGMAILVVSSEMPEVIGMCDRVLIFRGGSLAGELMHDELTEQRIAYLATTNIKETNKTAIS